MSRRDEVIEVPAVDPSSTYFLPAGSDVWLFGSRRRFHANAGGVTDCGRDLAGVSSSGSYRAVSMPLRAINLDGCPPCRRCYL